MSKEGGSGREGGRGLVENLTCNNLSCSEQGGGQWEGGKNGA